MVSLRPLFVAGLVGCGCGVVLADPPPPVLEGSRSVKLTLLASGLADEINGEAQNSPTDVVPDGTGRLFVATLGGLVRVIDSQGNLLATPFLTQAQTNNTPDGLVSPTDTIDYGMTSIAFHPDFSTMGAGGYGKFYTITTEPNKTAPHDFGANGSHQDVIKEWTLADPTATVWGANAGDSVREVLRVAQYGQLHNITDLAFGPDKLLYLSSGDGGRLDNAEIARNLSSVYGKILRIDPFGNNSGNGKYGIPSDNPFVDDGDPDTLAEIWASGLRSPFRMTIDQVSGDVWVGDVGARSIEEVDRIVKGGDFGWSLKEGSYLFMGSRVEDDTPENNDGVQTVAQQFNLIDPVYEYGREDGRTVVGGFVYRGSLLPELYGKYIFADLGQGVMGPRLFYGAPDTGEFWSFQIDPMGEALPFRIISIGEDENGELLLTGVGLDPRQGGGIDGVILRIVPEPTALVLVVPVAGLVLTRRPRKVRR